MTLHQTEFENELNKRVARIRQMDQQEEMGKVSNMQVQMGTVQTPYSNGEAVPGISGDYAKTYRPPTLREQAEKSTIHHREQLDKHAKAADFFRSHPEFDEFIQLIRAGVIQL